MFKRSFVSVLVAAGLSAVTLVSAVQPSAAGSWHHHHRRDAAIAGIAGLGGFILGSALAQPRTVYVEPDDGGSWHVRRCLSRYRSYDPGSDTYVGYDGLRRYCNL